MHSCRMMDRDELRTLPNMLTMVRIASLPVLYALYFLDHFLVFAFLYCISGITDMLDGYLARKLNQVTKSGQFLDSIADMFFNLSTGFFLFHRLHELRALYRSPLLMMVVLGVVYLVVSIVRCSRLHFMHTTLFRLAGVSIYVCFVTSFFVMPIIMIHITIALLSIAFIESIIIYFVFGEVEADMKSLIGIHRYTRDRDIQSPE